MEAPNQLRILVADDHPIYRDGMARAVDGRKDMRIIAQCDNADEALHRVLKLEPDVAVLDVQMPGTPVDRVIEQIVAGGKATRVLVLSAFHDRDTVTRMLEAGATGYLTKDTARDIICNAISRVASGETVIGHEAQQGVVDQLRVNRERERSLLTDRELECLELLAEGLSSGQIADRLVLGQATIKTHLHNVYSKLDVSGSAAAVAEGMRRGLIR